MRVADNVARRIDLLWRREEVRIRVDEVAGLEVLDGHLDREVLVRGDRCAIGGEDELASGHVRGCGDDSHRRWIA